jgi:hypothetical protein
VALTVHRRKIGLVLPADAIKRRAVPSVTAEPTFWLIVTTQIGRASRHGTNPISILIASSTLAPVND